MSGLLLDPPALPARTLASRSLPAQAHAAQASHGTRSALPRWLGTPRRLTCGIALDRLAPLWLMLCLLLASWPQTLWMARRMVDGSDDPLGVLALGALLAVLLAHRQHLRQSPDLRWLLAAMALVGAAGWAQATLPNLLAALLAMLGLACGVRALLPARVASGPVLLLAVLALPLLASLQYFVGYPLRVLVAEATRWLLSGTHSVSREGAALVVDGQLVLVDAACSGVQLAWLGYFCAASLALLRGLPTRQFMTRLPLVGAVVLLGNIARNAVLVLVQADGQPLTGWPHEAIGLLALVAVCLAVSHVMWGVVPHHEAVPSHRLEKIGGRLHIPNSLAKRIGIKGLCVSLMPLLALLQLGSLLLGPSPTQASTSPSVEWPRSWQGQPLRPLAFGEVEARFAANFPGQIARLTNGQDLLIWRHVTQPTRMLHPAADCYKALGYRVHSERLQSLSAATAVHQFDAAPIAGQGGLWRCFIAEQGGQRLRVCEQLQDAQGQVFTDTSAWYWAAALGRSSGPWQSLTVAQAL